jgi:hypothetical protein
MWIRLTDLVYAEVFCAAGTPFFRADHRDTTLEIDIKRKLHERNENPSGRGDIRRIIACLYARGLHYSVCADNCYAFDYFLFSFTEEVKWVPTS